MPAVNARVQLIAATPHAEQTVAAAGRLCYAQQTDDLLEHPVDDPAGFIGKLIGMGHLSLIEHAGFTFYIEGVSRAMTHQLVRHRLASYSQRSQRYVSHDEFDFIVPPQLEGKTVTDEQGREVDAVAYFAETMSLIAQRYARINDALGRSGEKSNQDARYVLPNACETKIIMTMNARELHHFFEERLCMRAQWEIRHVADQMLTLARAQCPGLFSHLGPKCIRLGHCPEGKLTCGQYAQMKEIYG